MFGPEIISRTDRDGGNRYWSWRVYEPPQTVEAAAAE